MILMFVRVKVVVVVVGVLLKGVLDTETSVNNYIHHKNKWSTVGPNEMSVRLRKCPQEAMNSSDSLIHSAKVYKTVSEIKE